MQPVQIATEVLNEAQNAIAGWRRVLDVLDTPPDVVDPGADGRHLPPGPVEIDFTSVGFAYPGGPEVLSDVDLTIAGADQGRGGRRDRQRQDDVRQAADPADGPDPRRGAAWPASR